MYFEQFHLPQLGHASYLVGDPATGAAVVVDPQLDAQQYLDAAAAAGLRIEYVLDTHAHSDYRSGRESLAAAAGATVLVSGHGAVPAHAHRALVDDELLELGDVWVRAVHMPGHAPEQLALLVGSGGDPRAPELVLSSGSLLCGDIGRPDIADALSVSSAAPAAIACIREKLLSLEDHVRVYPTHVAGSLCSASADGATETTIGHERAHNPWLRDGADVEAQLRRLPRKPAFWTQLRDTNERCMPVVNLVRELVELAPGDALSRLEDGALLLDAREADDFAEGHPGGTVHLGATAMAPVLAGALLQPSTRTVVLADDAASALRLAQDVQRVGVAAPVGWARADMAAWNAAGATIDAVATERPDALVAAGMRVLDVRQPAEWATGTAAGSLLLSLPDIPELGSDLPPEPLAVACTTGRRSITAVSLLRHLGRCGEVSVDGGVGEWADAGGVALAVPT